MQINKFILITIGILAIGCQSKKKELGIAKRERNVVEESLDKTIRTREEMRLIGKVRSILEYDFESANWSEKMIKLRDSKYHLISVDSSINEIRDITIKESNSYLFDKSGRLIKHIRFVEDGEVYMEDLDNFIFDRKGKLIEWNNADFDKVLDAQGLYVYDKKGRLIEWNWFHFNDSLVTKGNIYYKRDTIQFEEVTTLRGHTTHIERRKYNKYGEWLENATGEIKEYDQHGNLMKVSYKDLGEVISYSITYEYDFRNNKVRETEYDSTNKVVKTEMFYYNEKDRLIQAIKIDSIGTEIERYDESGNVFEYTGISFSKEEHTFYGFWKNFDQYGNVIKRIKIGRDEKGKLNERVFRIELEYDELGNWVTKKGFYKDSLVTMSERKIKYY